MFGFHSNPFNMRFIIEAFFFFFFLFLPVEFCLASSVVFSVHEGVLLRFRFLDKLSLDLFLFKSLVNWGPSKVLLLISFFMSSDFDFF